MTPALGLVQLAPPGTGGVADHMDTLAAAWQRLGHASARLQLAEADVRTLPLARRLADAAPKAGRIGLLVHFSAYGYAPRGLCRWLVDAVADARRTLDERLVVATLFHELHASGPPWTSAFWTSRLQAAIARDLARISDIVRTNSAWHAAWLGRQLGPEVPVHVAPVFSTVGEEAPARPPSARPATLVVFGGRATRQRAFDGLAGGEGRLAELGVRTLIEIGSGAPCTPPPGLPPCRHAGALPAAEVAAALRDARYALIDYPGVHLAKSSVFGAYASAGCVVLDTRPGLEAADGLEPGTHYLDWAQPGGVEPERLDRIAAAARGWYLPHALDIQARDHLRLLGERAGALA